jgi:hypothetical protein
VNLDTRVKLEVYSHFAETGRRPLPKDVVGRVDSDVESVLGTYQRLRAQRVLVLEADGSSIRMAPPFSGVPHSISWKQAALSISPIAPGTHLECLPHYASLVRFILAASNPASLFT